jgi:membrane-associated protein
VLARVAGWSFLNVFAALTLGSLVGSALDFAVGRLLCRGGQTEATGDAAGGSSPERQAGLARILAGFRKYGPIFLVVNRFLPGIRAFFFVAAGMARIPLWKVLFYSTLSAAAWNGLLLLAGWLIGDNLPQLEELVRTYFAVAWILLAVVALVVGVRWWQGRRASRPAP